jgi:hypothetical protein
MVSFRRLWDVIPVKAGLKRAGQRFGPKQIDHGI